MQRYMAFIFVPAPTNDPLATGPPQKIMYTTSGIHWKNFALQHLWLVLFHVGLDATMDHQALSLIIDHLQNSI